MSPDFCDASASWVAPCGVRFQCPCARRAVVSNT